MTTPFDQSDQASNNQVSNIPPERIERAIKIAAKAFADALRAELLTTPPQASRRPSKTRDRIMAVLTQAPTMAQDHPTLARFLSVRAMPKTMLRSKVGNATKDFDSVIQAMVDDKTLLTGPATSAKGRSITVYGLAS